MGQKAHDPIEGNATAMTTMKSLTMLDTIYVLLQKAALKECKC